MWRYGKFIDRSGCQLGAYYRAFQGDKQAASGRKRGVKARQTAGFPEAIGGKELAKWRRPG
jgi:hypothetical protein